MMRLFIRERRRSCLCTFTHSFRRYVKTQWGPYLVLCWWPAEAWALWPSGWPTGWRCVHLENTPSPCRHVGERSTRHVNRKQPRERSENTGDIKCKVWRRPERLRDRLGCLSLLHTDVSFSLLQSSSIHLPACENAACRAAAFSRYFIESGWKLESCLLLVSHKTPTWRLFIGCHSSQPPRR